MQATPIQKKTTLHKTSGETKAESSGLKVTTESSPASPSQKAKLAKVLTKFSHLLAGGNITAKNEGLRKDIGTIATNTESLKTKKEDIQTKIDKAVTGLDKAKLLFEKKILGALIKGIATNIDAIMKNSVCQNIAKSLLMTKTRITPEDIVKKTDNQNQKTEWLSTIQSLGILRDDGKSLRISPENLEKIKTRLHTLETNREASIDPMKIGSETKLCKLLIKSYEDRIAIKTAFKTDKAGLINSASSLAVAVITTINSEDLGSPEKLLKKIVQSCKEDPALKGHIQDMISDKDNPLHKVIVSVAGEAAIHALNIATSEEGLAIAEILISAGNVDMATSFMEDPIGTLLNNKDLLTTTAAEAFDHVVALLDNTSATDSILALSKGKLQQADINLLKSILPLAKEVISELASDTPTPTESPSKAALLMSKIAGHMATRCDLELANIQASSPGEASLPVSETISQLTTGLNNSIALLTKLTVGLPETQSPPSMGSTNTPEKEAPTDQSWGGWVSSWGSSVVAGASNIAQFGTNVAVQTVAMTLGDTAGLYVETTIGNVSEALSDTATYMSDSVVSAATTIGNIPSNIISTAVDMGIDVAASKAAGKIDKAIDKALDQTEEPKKASTEITLNKEKLTEFMAQSVSLLSHFIAENPAVLDTMGNSATTLIITVSDILQNQELDTSERANTLCETLKSTLADIGQSIIEAGGETATQVGSTLINTGALLGSDLVKRSLEKSTAFTPETISKAGQFGALKIRHLVFDKVTNTLSSIDAPKIDLPKEQKNMRIPQKVATALNSYSSTNMGNIGGMIGRVVNFVGLGAAKGGLDIASQIIQVK